MKKAKVMEPVGGSFLVSVEERKRWCARNGHPQIYLNLSKSAKTTKGVQVFQCHCGEVQSEQRKAAK